MSTLLLQIQNNTQACLSSFICVNENFVSIYGVIFTIIITIGVYIFGLQDADQKIALIKVTNIRQVIMDCLKFFALSFIAFPSPFYEFVNFLIVGSLVLNICNSFRGIFRFNENKFSGQKMVKEFKEDVINEKLKEFNELKFKNDEIEKILEEKRNSKEIERFLFDESNESYYLIRAQNSGYIADINLDVLFAKDNGSENGDNELPQKRSYYIPYGINNGSAINFDDVILGVKKENENQEIDEDRLRSYVSIKDEATLLTYLEAEIRPYYSEMFGLIKTGDSKSLELKLKDFSSFINRFITKSDSYIGIIQSINDEIVFPLQREAFKQEDVDCIRKVVGFALGYLYESLDKKSLETFNIFLRNLGNAFYESLYLPENKKLEFHDVYFRWLKEVAKYSIKPRTLKDEDYLEYQISLLSSLNGILKLTFERQDSDAFSKTLEFLDGSFSRESYEYDELPVLAKMVANKKAVIFGFTAWVYKYYSNRKEESFYGDILSKLLDALKQDPQYSYRDQQDDLNYYLATYLKAVDFSEKRGSFGWDSWGMPTETVYTVTIRHDIQNLLTDRILKILVENPVLEIVIRDKNYDDMLSNIKEGNQQFDPLYNKSKLNFVSTTNITDEQFAYTKIKFYEIFKKITEQYEDGVKKQLIEQNLDRTKFDEFVKENFEAYEKARVLDRIQKFVKDEDKKKDGFGYNILLHKEQFVTITNIHYVHGSQFGEELARSEDNKVLESIYKKFESIPVIKKEKIGQLVSKEKNVSAVVLWINGHFRLQDANPETFTPYWQEINSKQDNGKYYQGSINGVPVYIIYKFQEHKKYPDTVFVLEDNAFSVHEFEIEKDENDNTENTMFAEDSKNCLTLSITNLSPLKDHRAKIAEKWIENDPATNREESIEKMKTNVVFKFFKGISTENIEVDKSKIKIFYIK